MTLTLDRKTLLAAVAQVSRAIHSRSTLPILANILIEVDGAGTARFAATDLELAIETRIAAPSVDPGAVTLPAATLREVLGALPDGEVTLTADERHSVTITAGRSVTTLLGLPAEEFPSMPEVAPDLSFTMPQAALHRMIRQVGIAVSDDQTRPIITGISVTLDGGALAFAATDTHRLAVRTERLENPPDATMGVILPGRSLNELSRALDSTGDETVTVTADENQVRFETGALRLVTRRIEGMFPKYERVIPTRHTSALAVAVEDLADALRRVSVVARENSHRVTLECAPDLLVLSAQAGEIGSAREEVPATLDGPPVTLMLNARYLDDALGVIDGERVEFRMTQPAAPVTLRDPEDAALTLVVMPMAYV